MTTNTTFADPRERIIPAVDVDTFDKAAKIVDDIGGYCGPAKYGLELCHAEGTPEVAAFGNARGRTFLDLKLHDIPTTVMKTVLALARHRAMMTNLHALGGPKMMKAAVQGREEGQDLHGHRTAVLAVTFLTSHDYREGVAIGVFSQLGDTNPLPEYEVAFHHISDFVLRKTEQALEAGCDGIICAAREVPGIRRRFGDDVLTICPGGRSLYYPSDDQARPTTPLEAVEMGVDYQVVGRQLTKPAPILAELYGKPVEELTPLDALNAIGDEISGRLVVKNATELAYVDARSEA